MTRVPRGLRANAGRDLGPLSRFPRNGPRPAAEEPATPCHGATSTNGTSSSARFQPGNTRALTHGANSDRTVSARAEVVQADIVAAAPWLDRPHLRPALERYAAASAREALLHEHIMELSAAESPSAVGTRVWEQATAAARLAAKLARDLGLVPRGRVMLREMGIDTRASRGSGHEARPRPHRPR